MLKLQVELLSLGLLLAMLVLVPASVVEPELVPQPHLMLMPQSVPVLDSELEWMPSAETESQLREEAVFLVHRSPAPRCQADARKRCRRPPQPPTSHTTCEFPTVGPLPTGPSIAR
eukprot:COSAG02_NODE_2193_length_9555_cov_102.183481_9_plen_116_part_00